MRLLRSSMNRPIDASLKWVVHTERASCDARRLAETEGVPQRKATRPRGQRRSRRQVDVLQMRRGRLTSTVRGVPVVTTHRKTTVTKKTDNATFGNWAIVIRPVRRLRNQSNMRTISARCGLWCDHGACDWS